MNDLANKARGISSLRDFLELLEGEGQAITWSERVLPEPDVRKIAVAAPAGDRASDRKQVTA